MAAHRYWRIYVTAVNNPYHYGSYYGGNPAFVIGAASLRTTTGGANVATGGTAYASSGSDAGKAFDGSPSNAFFSGDGSALPQWVAYDLGLGNAKAIVQLALQLDDYDDYLIPYSFTVEYSDDNATWYEGATVSSYAMSPYTEYTFTVVSGDAAPTNSAPEITSNGGGMTANIAITENTTAVTTVTATDADLDTITYSISGIDAALFTIDSVTGVLAFTSAPDYESPLDSDEDNIYLVTVSASDGTLTTNQALTIIVTDEAAGVGVEPVPGINWRRVVTIGGVDVSALITGEAIVEKEKSTSRIASFLLRPQAGTISAGDWLGAAVTINYQTVTSSGTIITDNRLFTGTVDQALYDPNTRLTSFDCTDEMQARFEAMTQAEIDALIVNSRWSQAVFGDYSDGWLHFENVLNTYPQSYDYNADGITGVLADLAAKATADYSYDSANIIDGSISYSIAPKRDLFNSYTISYSYRFGRLLHRKHSFAWSLNFCPYFAQSHELPTREMITSAATSAGWNVTSNISFDSLPASAADPCNYGISWSISDENRELLALAARWTASKRWSQTVTENYTITVNAPQSVTWLGEVAYKESASNNTELDSDGWVDSVATPSGRINSQNDIVQDKYDRTASDNDINTLIARARTEILASHRANYVSAEVLLNPLLEVYHTVRLDDNGITGQGTVESYTHRMNTDTGDAVTKITISVSLNGGGDAISDTAITAPAAPNTDPLTPAPTANTVLATNIGGDDGGEVFSEAWTGFMGNYSVPVGTPAEDQYYPRQFVVDTPDINQDAVDAIEGERIANYSFNIPNELLTITVT